MKKIVFFLTLSVLITWACGNSSNQVTDSKAVVSSDQFNANGMDNPYAKQFGLDIEHYFNSYNNAVWDQVIETTYRPLFGDKTNEEITTQYIQGKLQGMERKVDVKRVAKISGVVSKGNYIYSKIFLDADVEVKLSGGLLEDPDFIKNNLELSYDTNDLVFNEKSSSFLIKDAYVQMIAISVKGTNLWKYIEVDKQKEPLYALLMPPNVLEQLDK